MGIMAMAVMSVIAMSMAAMMRLEVFWESFATGRVGHPSHVQVAWLDIELANKLYDK